MGAIDPRYPPPARMHSAATMKVRGGDFFRAFLAGLSEQKVREIGNPITGACDWNFWARDEQLEPSGDWSTWFYLAGRGTGKTRSGAEWVLKQVRNGVRIIHMIAPTEADYRDVMINGPAGLINIAREDERPTYIKQDRKVLWPNGAYALCFSAEQPERLRGPQCEAVWADEVAAWRYVDQTWDMMSFGLRLGTNPRVMVSTTPKPIPLIKRLVKDPKCAITRGTTHDNRANLAEKFFADQVARYEGTRLGRQELYADILTDNPDALFKHEQLDRLRVRLEDCPPLDRIIVAVDPPTEAGEDADECGIMVVGKGADGHGYVLGDYSAQGLMPDAWARKALRAYSIWNATAIVVEVNQGGKMVRNTIEQANSHYLKLPIIPIREVRAKQGKVTRAEPVSALYEQGRVHHVRTLRGPRVVFSCGNSYLVKQSALRPHRHISAHRNLRGSETPDQRPRSAFCMSDGFGQPKKITVTFQRVLLGGLGA